MTLPGGFVQMIEQTGAWQFDGLLHALESSSPETSVRLNPLKRGEGIKLPDNSRRVPWHPYGYYLPSRPLFTFDPAMHQGAYYVQEASSMFIAHAVERAVEELGNNTPVTYLDACAAPGGKTTCVAPLLPDGSVIVANELDKARCSVLVENICKQGVGNSIVTCGDATLFANTKMRFNIIAIDAPCSGEGMMRKEKEAVQQWDMQLVKQCASTQRNIIDALWKILVPGGVMIYSTCTFNTLENENQLAHIVEDLGGEPLDLKPEKEWGIVGGICTEYPCYRFIPGRTKGEGLFICAIKKPGNRPDAPTGKQKRKAAVPPIPLPDGWTVAENSDGSIRAMSPEVAATYNILDGKAKIIYSGVELGTMKGRDFIPSQALAMSPLHNAPAYPEAEIYADTAIAYLRREQISLPTDTPRGFVMLTHNGLPLGYVKNLGNRCNNLYPKQWRVLTEHSPITLADEK